MKPNPIRSGETVETVYTVTNPVQAEMVRNLLQGHNIPCQLDGDHQAGFTGALEIGVLVRASDAAAAHHILKEFSAEPLDE